MSGYLAKITMEIIVNMLQLHVIGGCQLHLALLACSLPLHCHRSFGEAIENSLWPFPLGGYRLSVGGFALHFRGLQVPACAKRKGKHCVKEVTGNHTCSDLSEILRVNWSENKETIEENPNEN